MNPRELASPKRLSPTGRALEIAQILALAIVRTHAEEGPTESPLGLGFSAGKRLHTTPPQQGDA